MNETESKTKIDWTKPIEIYKGVELHRRAHETRMIGKSLFRQSHPYTVEWTPTHANSENTGGRYFNCEGASHIGDEYTVRNAAPAPNEPLATPPPPAFVPTPHEPVEGVTLWNASERTARAEHKAAEIKVDGVFAGFFFDSGTIPPFSESYGYAFPRTVTNPAHTPAILTAFRDKVRAERLKGLAADEDNCVVSTGGLAIEMASAQRLTPHEQRIEPEAEKDWSAVTTPKGRVVTLRTNAPCSESCIAIWGKVAAIVSRDGVAEWWNTEVDCDNTWPLPDGTPERLDAYYDSLAAPEAEKPLWVEKQVFVRAHGVDPMTVYYVFAGSTRYDCVTMGTWGDRPGRYPSIAAFEAAIRSGELVPADAPPPAAPAIERRVPWTQVELRDIALRVRLVGGVSWHYVTGVDVDCLRLTRNQILTYAELAQPGKIGTEIQLIDGRIVGSTKPDGWPASAVDEGGR